MVRTSSIFVQSLVEMHCTRGSLVEHCKMQSSASLISFGDDVMFGLSKVCMTKRSWVHRSDCWSAVEDRLFHTMRFCVADAYEVEFHRTLAGLANRVSESIRPVDRPPDVASVWCRKVFSELKI